MIDLMLLLYADDKYHKSTEISSLRKKELRMIGEFAIDFCIDTLGKNKNKPRPKLSIRKNPFRDSTYGDYTPDENKIRIFHDHHKTLGTFTSTIIHEYTHHLQPIEKKYYKLLMTFGYDNHPHEIQAEENEKLYNDSLLEQIKIHFH